MALRSIATLSLSFGLVSIPVKVYSATATESAVRFKLLARGGARLRQQYVAYAPLERERSDDTRAATSAVGPPAPLPQPPRQPPAAAASAPRTPEPGDGDGGDAEAVAPQGVVDRHDIVKGYEFEKGRYVVFTPAELNALAEASRQTIDIVAFIPEHAVDPIYYDKAYYLVPAAGGQKPYALLLEALRASGRRALARWAWRAKEYVVEIRPEAGGLVLQQLLYADEVRPIDALGITPAPVGAAELKLALQLIEQNSEAAYDPTQFVDEEKQRVLEAVAGKVAGRQVLAEPAAEPAAAMPGAQVIDLMAALRASLKAPIAAAGGAKDASEAAPSLGARKPARRAAKPPAAAAASASPSRRRAKPQPGPR